MIRTMFFGVSQQVTDAAAPASYIFEDDFNRSDSGTLGNGWNETETGATIGITSNKLSYAKTGDGSNWAYQSVTEKTSGYVTLKFHINFSTLTAGSNGSFYIADGGQDNNLNWLTFDSGGQIRVIGDSVNSALVAWSTSTDYTIYVETDITNQKITKININGTDYTNGGSGWGGLGATRYPDRIYTRCSGSARSNFTSDYVQYWEGQIGDEP